VRHPTSAGEHTNTRNAPALTCVIASDGGTAPLQTSCEDEDGPRGSALRDAGPLVREGEAMQTAAALSMCHAILRTCQAGGHAMIPGEPKLDDLLAEPIVLLRAKSAGLSPEELRALCVRLRARLVQR
jgi:hypothetical protein